MTTKFQKVGKHVGNKALLCRIPRVCKHMVEFDLKWQIRQEKKCYVYMHFNATVNNQ